MWRADLSKDELEGLGCEALPNNLETALTRMTASAWAKSAFGETLIDVIDRHKRAEIEVMAGLSPEEICTRYTKAY